jgi:hypothetical protein
MPRARVPLEPASVSCVLLVADNMARRLTCFVGLRSAEILLVTGSPDSNWLMQTRRLDLRGAPQLASQAAALERQIFVLAPEALSLLSPSHLVIGLRSGDCMVCAVNEFAERHGLACLALRRRAQGCLPSRRQLGVRRAAPHRVVLPIDGCGRRGYCAQSAQRWVTSERYRRHKASPPWPAH